jgi:hypothetical protein
MLKERGHVLLITEGTVEGFGYGDIECADPCIREASDIPAGPGWCR